MRKAKDRTKLDNVGLDNEEKYLSWIDKEGEKNS